MIYIKYSHMTIGSIGLWNYKMNKIFKLINLQNEIFLNKAIELKGRNMVNF